MCDKSYEILAQKIISEMTEEDQINALSKYLKNADLVIDSGERQADGVGSVEALDYPAGGE